MAVTPETISVALGQAAPPEGSTLWEQWEMWISDALMLIGTRAEQVGKSVDDIDQAKLDYVVREAVTAHVKRPDDATTVMVSVDDAQSSKTYRSGAGRVAIRDEWWTLLGLVETSGAFTFDRAPAARAYHLPWCSTAWGAPCSCGANIAGRPIYEAG